MDLGEKVARATGATRNGIRIFAVFLTLAVSASAASLPAVAAPNENCGGSTAVECPDVPADGISYGAPTTSVTITDGGGNVDVDPGVIGIDLHGSGGGGTDATAEVTFDNTIEVDIGTEEHPNKIKVLADSHGNPILLDGKQIEVRPDDDDEDDHGTLLIDNVELTDEQVLDLYDVITDLGGGGNSVTAGLTVTNDNAGGRTAADFTTTNANGISVTSAGGKGGKGGCSTILWLYTWCGGGSRGGDAESVAVNNDGTIIVDYAAGSATGNTSTVGIYATSTGGAGGDGGGDVGLVSDAGSGGTGGKGGDVFVTLGANSVIQTNGAGGHGVYATSSGGDGGRGGEAKAGFALGAAGGNGGDAGKVTVSNAGSITTNGSAAHGIYAQSVGAGAGSGSNASGILAIGGSGGGESDGNLVTVTNTGTIHTKGIDSFGILAQSIGGGGGDGGGTSGLFSVGGGGGSGGNSNTVTVRHIGGAITTDEEGSIGIFAQSVGGGGGNGGDAYAAGLGGSLSIGGNGGLGGDGGTVIINGLDSGETVQDDLAAATIKTNGDRAHGIQAQSIGGSGGNGGLAVSGALGDSFSLAIALGGSGEHGGSAKSVTVNYNGSITTAGVSANGIFAQSVGGGGGSGGGAIAASAALGASINFALGGSGAEAGNGETVTVRTAGSISTTGNLSSGILAQSVGGGGGNGGFSVAAGASGVLTASVGVGGKGGGGGQGGTVLVDNAGTITTKGDLSYGVLAQSVGGGGGNGGWAVAAGLTLAPEGGISAAVAVGGDGGSGSKGGNVTVVNSGSIYTGTETPQTVEDEEDGEEYQEIIRTGNGAHGLFAQSIGGGGGNGGFAGAGSLTIGDGGSFSVAVGGKGATGADAGSVDVTNTAAMISTLGDGANGIHAQAVGGGGGDGGFGLSLAGGIGSGTNISIGVAVGGGAGGGGFGGIVDVDNFGAIETKGRDSNGIFAQSVGGGGGNGGWGGAATVAISGNTGQLGVAVGGSGGAGSYGKLVTVDNAGAITTHGEGSRGILAQSIGGGGGNGGMSIVANVSTAQSNSASLGASVGGEGGTGTQGGTVEVTNLAAGKISTSGFGAHGIQAQSIGGGGGNGGMAIYGGFGISGTGTALNAGVAVGGAGGNAVPVGEDGAYGSLVKVLNDGDIRVRGDNAMGIFAHSIGGGGGNGGNSINAMLAIANPNDANASTYNIAVSVGGGGGSGSHGGVVTVVNTGAIETGDVITIEGKSYVTGVGGYGVFAQSVGGGGGVGGRSNAINVVAGPKCKEPTPCPDKANKGNNLALTATIGGSGGAAGDGGAVTVENEGTITTWGSLADGIFAQSIGGGGGVGGNGILGTGELLPFPIEMLFMPVGQTSQHKNLSVAVGGDGGASGRGDLVTVTNKADITTHGGGSNGIFAQSVGGGGGVGGLAAIGVVGKIGVGGEGGAGGNGGDVIVDNIEDARIETYGETANGIYAQSVGGGGGIGGNVNRMFASGLDTPAGHLSINLGIGLALLQGGGAGGDGGAVTVTSTGEVVTHGDNAAGIFAQSIGGGGGVLGEVGNDVPVLSALNWHIGSNGDAGSAGVVTVDVDGLVQTSGNSSTGIFAQSSGGQGVGEDVIITLDGKVETAALLDTEQDGTASNPLRGLGSVGIMAHSAGISGNGNVTIDIESSTGLVKGGRSAVVADTDDHYAEYVGVGIWVVDGKDNKVTNRGTITTANGVDAGMAIYATGSDAAHAQAGGNETILNYGTVTGSVDLGAGSNSFDNFEGSTFNTGAFARIGGDGLTNDGRINVGGMGKVMRTDVTGELIQTGTGVYGVDLDLNLTLVGDEADLLAVNEQLTMDGEVDLNILNVGRAASGSHQVAIAQSATAFTNNGITIDSEPSLVASYGLSWDAKTLYLDYSIDFAVDGLNRNQTAIGDYINLFQLDGGTEDMDPLIKSLFYIPDLETYQQTLDALSPEPYLVNQVALLMSSLQFDKSLKSCRVYDGENRFSTEGECAWASVSHRAAQRDADSEWFGYDSTSMSLSTGAQVALADGLHAGLGVSYEDTWTTSNNSVTDGTAVHVGGVLKGQYGGTSLAASLTGGYGFYDVTRDIELPNGPFYQVEGSQEIGYVGAHLLAAHTFEAGNFYLRPMVDLGVTQVHVSGFDETGDSPLALEVESADNTYVTIAPAIELGGELQLGQDGVLRSFLRAGVTEVVAGDAAELSAGFAGVQDGVTPFTIIHPADETMVDLTAGFDVIGAGGGAVRFQTDARFGESTTTYGGSMKLSGAF